MGFAFDALANLRELYHERLAISHYLEKDQALDRVLNIFIRVNSGATKLSYSDLLMSIAAAQWSGDPHVDPHVDARELVHGLVDELNAVGDGFDFSKDFVLKAGLMLSDIASVGFKVDNFNAGNMAKLRHNWDAVGNALKTTVHLAHRLGLSGKSLTADSALLPVAYHVHQRGVGNDLVTSNKHRDERDAVASFLRRSLLKSGVWGAGLDTTLTALRETLRQHPGQPFPLDAVEKTMRERGRSLGFADEEIDGLLETSYGDKRLIPLLSLLFPEIDLKNHLHVDHVYPRSRLSRSKLGKSKLTREQAADLHDRRDELPNLQFLDGTENAEKLDRPPVDWIAEQYPDASTRTAYLDRHLLGDLPATVEDVPGFLDARREKLRDRLRKRLATAA